VRWRLAREAKKGIRRRKGEGFNSGLRTEEKQENETRGGRYRKFNLVSFPIEGGI